MRNVALLSFAFLAFLAIPATRASAQDYDAMAKWTEAKVIRFHATGDYTGELLIGGRTTKVTDHVEFDFEWDNAEMKVIGKPVIKNFPTKLGPLMPLTDHPLWGGCPEPKIETAPEQWTLQSITNASALLWLEGNQDSAAGSFPNPPEGALRKCGETWTKATVTSRTIKLDLQLLPAMMLEMPETMMPAGVKVSKDHKSFLMNTDNGWTWTFTPTIVK